MLKRIIAIIVLALLLLAGTSVLADAPAGNGQIQGTLVNKTAGSTSNVANQLVTLESYQGSQQLDSSIVRTDDGGKYSFTGLSTDPGYTYEVDASYQGADYFSDPLQFAAGETTKAVDLEVNDTTSSDENISINLSHVVLAKDSSGLNVTQYYNFANSGDRAYVGVPSSALPGKNETVKLVLPPGATGMQIAYGLQDSELIQNGSNLTDTVAVTPAGREISFSYELPANAKFAWTFEYPVTRFDILTSDTSIKLSGSKLTAEQPLAINGVNYQDYDAEQLAKGDTVFAALDNSAASVLGHFNFQWLLLVPIAAVLAAIAVVIIKRKKKAPGADYGAASQSPSLKEKLLNEIAALDDSFEQGKIEPKEYEKLRSDKKRKLVALAEVMEELHPAKD